MTALYDNIIFGPVRSRRLGISLGVNLLPVESKLCSFDCIYCECGWNADHPGRRRFNAREDVREMLAATLEIIEDTLALRDQKAPLAKVSVLSNATQIHREDVRRALRRVDNNILKLDSAFDSTVQLINKPCGNYTVERQVELMKLFDGEFILQTMFLRGEYNGQLVDNTTEEEVAAWLEIVKELRPSRVMVYSLDRDTPCKTLVKVEREELQQIAKRVEALGIECPVA